MAASEKGAILEPIDSSDRFVGERRPQRIGDFAATGGRARLLIATVNNRG
jgi:hypothetical protein